MSDQGTTLAELRAQIVCRLTGGDICRCKFYTRSGRRCDICAEAEAIADIVVAEYQEWLRVVLENLYS